MLWKSPLVQASSWLWLLHSIIENLALTWPATLLSLCCSSEQSSFKATYVVDSLNSPESPVVGAVYGLVYRIHLMVCVNFVWTRTQNLPQLRGHEHDRSSEARGQSTGSWCGSHLRPGWWRRWPHRRGRGMELLSENLCVRFFSCLEYTIGNCCIFQNSSLKIENDSAEILLSKCCPNSSNHLKPPIIYIYMSFYIHWRFPGRHVTGKAHGPTIAQVTLPRPFCCPR